MKKIRWDHIYGHDVQKQQLEKLLIGGMPHCLLFAGQEGIGKKMIAERLARFFRCQNKIAPCFECAGCRDFLNHGNFLINNDLNLALDIEKFRSLKKELDRTDFSGGARLVIVDNVNLLSNVVANALLKVLEEPTDNVVFILLATDLKKVLPTIRSRCVAIQFNKLDKDEVEKMVTEWGEIDLIGNRSLLISGQPALIKRLLVGNTSDIILKMISFWKMMLADYWVKSEITKKISALEKDKILGIIFFWEVCLRSFLLWKNGMEKYCWWHGQELLEWYNSCNFTNGQVINILDKLGELRISMARNCNKKIQIFNFILES